MVTSAQKSPAGIDTSPQQSRWWSFQKHFWGKIRDVLRFSSVKNWLTQMTEYWKQWLSSRRRNYIPLTTLFILLLSASQADAQCCGAQANLEVWLKVWNTTNFTDVLSANNWHTNDGLTLEINWSFHQSVLMVEVGLWYGRLWQVQDVANKYTGDFSHVAGRVMLAWSSDRSFVPYAGIQGWYIHSQVEWIYWWVPYEYSWGRLFWWPVVWANVNFGEVVTLWIGAQSTYFITNSDTFEWVVDGDKSDSQGRWPYPGMVFGVLRYRFQ